MEAVNQKLTYYWVVHEREFPSGTQAKLNTCNGQNLARTSKAFADSIALEGSGYLRDGKTKVVRISNKILEILESDYTLVLFFAVS